MQDPTPFQSQRISTRIQDDDFFMYRYKIFKCPLQQTHDIQGCPYTHPGEASARRDPTVHKYSSVTCPDAKLGRECPRGRTCKFAHHMFEYWLHPSRYRTQMCRDGPSCKRTICFFAHYPGELRTPPKKERSDTGPAPPPEQRPGGPQLLAVHMDGSVAALTAAAAGLSLEGGPPGGGGGGGTLLPAQNAQSLALAAAGQGYTVMPAPGVPAPMGVPLPSQGYTVMPAPGVPAPMGVPLPSSGMPAQSGQGMGRGQQVLYGGMPPGYGHPQQAQQQQAMVLAGGPQGHAPGMAQMGAGMALLQPQGQGPMYVQQQQQPHHMLQQQPPIGSMQQQYWVPFQQQQMYHPQQPQPQEQAYMYQVPDHRQMQQHPQQMVQMMPGGGQQQVVGTPQGGYMLVPPPAAGGASPAMYMAAPTGVAGVSMGPLAAGTPPLTPGPPPAAASSTGASTPGAAPFPAWSGAPSLTHPAVQSMLLVPSSSPSLLQATTLPMPGLVGPPRGCVATSPAAGGPQWAAAARGTDLTTPGDAGGSGGTLPPGLS